MRPFLKWAGNKFKVLDHILPSLPPGQRLIEPFLGSGAVFLNTKYPQYLLSDQNIDLIYLFKYLQTFGRSYIEYCRQWFIPENNTQERYYEYREQFNKSEDRSLRSALFLYLNRHCFNGLCRYNSSGIFNVPFGSFKNTYFPENELMFFCQHAANSNIIAADFVTTMQQAEAGDVIYCDPPYVPLTESAHFNNYTGNGFGPHHQRELAMLAESLRARGVTVIISNHHTDFTQQLYKDAVCATFHVRRHISCKSRDTAQEVLALYTPS